MKARTAGAWASVALGGVLALTFLLCRTAGVEAAYPVERAASAFSRKVCTRLAGLAKGAESRAENVRLRREVAELSLVRADMARLEEENERLRRALGYAARQSGDWLPACVLSAGGGAAAAHKTVRTGKGALDGVAVGAVVVVPEGVVGRVTSVTPHTSEVTLIVDHSVKVACEIEVQDGSRPRGIVSGGGEDVLIMRYLRDAENVPPRSRVVTSGLGGVFPRGLEVGTYTADGEVLPSVDFSTLEDVFIRREK